MNDDSPNLPPTPKPDVSATTGQPVQAGKKRKPISLKPKLPPGPALNVQAFVALMRKLEANPSDLTNDQVRFVQLCIQRYQNDPQGLVKTKLAMPKPKKPRAAGPRPASAMLPSENHLHSDALLDRLTHAATEDEVIHELEQLSDRDAERLAASQGLRSTTPTQARQKLLETVITLRQMSRIQNAGKPSPSGTK